MGCCTQVAAIKVDDPKAELVNDVEDVERCAALPQHAWGVWVRTHTCSKPARVRKACCSCLRREFPGELDRIRVWFRDYKTPDGKPQNQFGYDEQWQNKDFTLQARAWQCMLLVMHWQMGFLCSCMHGNVDPS
jgi:inorganic pyrophosphatase